MQPVSAWNPRMRCVRTCGVFTLLLCTLTAHAADPVEPLDPPLPEKKQEKSSSHCGLGGGVALVALLGLAAYVRAVRR